MRGSQQARGKSARAFGAEKRESYGGNYSTVKSAQRLRATLSIRASGRAQIIDIFRGSILVSKDLYERAQQTCKLCATLV
jgi:hypothetical protein